ncbi:hypothetical protein ACP70R_023811 [Stipagrostis hirtigluma subsp. patula]
MAALGITGWILLVQAAAGLAHDHRRLPLRLRLLRYSAIVITLGASALFHAVASPDSRAVALAGFLLWVAGAALLMAAFTAGRFPAAALLAARIVEAAVAAFF